MNNDSSVSQVFTTRLQQLAGTLLYDDRLIKWMGGTAHSTECIEFNRAGITYRIFSGKETFHPE